MQVADGVASRRLHPSSILFSFLGHAKSLLLPAVVVIVFSSGDRWQLWLALFILPAMVFDIYRYITLRIDIVKDELVVTHGMFFRNERHIPLGRIQNIDLIQGVLARMLNVAEVRLETAGGSEPEAVFRVLSLDAVEEIRAGLRAHRAEDSIAAADDGDAPAIAEPAPLLKLYPSDVLRLGLDPGRGLAMVGIAWGVAWELGVFESVDLEDRARQFVTDTALPLSGVALGLLVALLVVMLLSMVSAVLRFTGYELRRDEDQFRLRYGLLTRLSATIPLPRIQFVLVTESPLQRIMRRATIKVRTAGGWENDESTVSRRWFVPLCTWSDVPRLLREIDPQFDLFQDTEWRPLAAGAARRLAKRAVIVAVLLTGICAFAWRPWGGVSGLVWLPLLLWSARREFRFAGWCRRGGVIARRSGVFYRTWAMTRVENVQVVARRESPFDRRYRMASLVVDTAADDKWGGLHLPYMERDVADELRVDLAAEAERTGFQWAGGGHR